MAKTLKHLNNMDDRTKYSVFGYIREWEKKLSLYNVPALVSYLCLNYFYGEYFSKTADKIEISNNGKTITNISSPPWYDNINYGNMWINSWSDTIAKWTMKCKGHDILKVFLSIVSDDNHEKAIYLKHHNKCPPNYGVNVNNLEDLFRYDQMQSLPKILNHFHRVKISSGEEFKFILNLKKRTIGMMIRGKEYIIFEQIEKRKGLRYKLAVSFFYNSTKDSISIIDFELTK